MGELRTSFNVRVLPWGRLVGASAPEVTRPHLRAPRHRFPSHFMIPLRDHCRTPRGGNSTRALDGDGAARCSLTGFSTPGHNGGGVGLGGAVAFLLFKKGVRGGWCVVYFYLKTKNKKKKKKGAAGVPTKKKKGGVVCEKRV